MHGGEFSTTKYVNARVSLRLHECKSDDTHTHTYACVFQSQARGSSMDEATIKKLVAGPEKEAEMLRRNRDRDANTIAHLRNQVTTLEQKVLELELHQEPVRARALLSFFFFGNAWW